MCSSSAPMASCNKLPTALSLAVPLGSCVRTGTVHSPPSSLDMTLVQTHDKLRIQVVLLRKKSMKAFQEIFLIYWKEKCLSTYNSIWKMIVLILQELKNFYFHFDINHSFIHYKDTISSSLWLQFSNERYFIGSDSLQMFLQMSFKKEPPRAWVWETGISAMVLLPYCLPG